MQQQEQQQDALLSVNRLRRSRSERDDWMPQEDIWGTEHGISAVIGGPGR
jgi:hypothetical protein